MGELHNAILASNVLLDGLLGIGARGEPREPLRAVIEVLNQVRARYPTLLVVAVDSPTGVDADSGVAAAVAVKADVTVVLGGAKRGLLTPRAALSTGMLIHADIGIVDGPEDAAEVVTRASVQDLLKPRPPDAHKGSFGRVLVVAGSEQYVGAAYLVCAAAIRAGAGIVSLAAPRWLRDVVAARLPEATYLPLPDGGFVGEPGESARLVCDRLDQFDAIALGPGLSTEGGAGQAVEAVLRARAGLGLPAVVDADGLNALAARAGWPDWIGPRVVLTPHWGELRRLLNEGPTDAEAPWELVRKLSAQWPVTLVLKGPFTAIGSDGCAWVHPRPNPSLATAGTGDVLTGVIAGLLARGLGPREAATLGVWAHGEAAARPSKGRPAGGLMASDLLPEIPYALAQAMGTRPLAPS
jgi:NAD(P)H-hydrate epimerase